MNTRICSVVAMVMLLSFTSGCSGMRNFLFGRGARCGMCNRLSNPLSTPGYDTTGQVPCESTPGSSCNQNVVTAPSGCGCSDSYGAAYGGQCACGESGYSSDPYLSGGMMPYEGQIIDQGVVVDGVVGSGTMSSDNFTPRFDDRGDRIINESPIGGIRN